MTTSHNRLLHYIPPRDFHPIEKEYVEPRPDDYFIWWLFSYRCIECRKSGTEINEIRPRARSKSAIMDWKNRVVLCRECHTEYHRTGVSTEKMQLMTERRSTYLKAIGREKYV